MGSPSLTVFTKSVDKALGGDMSMVEFGQRLDLMIWSSVAALVILRFFGSIWNIPMP